MYCIAFWDYFWLETFYTRADELRADSNDEHTSRFTVMVPNLRGWIHENLLKKDNIQDKMLPSAILGNFLRNSQKFSLEHLNFVLKKKIKCFGII